MLISKQHQPGFSAREFLLEQFAAVAALEEPDTVAGAKILH
ncbi:MAG: hypothetical protein U1F61_31280 [Opitutaceae bacterium]